jgi:hypothetical protein
MKNRGFTLFIAIVIMGTLLLISAGMVSLAVRQALISASGRESQAAFYAADTGIECALYWDVQNPSGVSGFATTSTSQINCNNQIKTVGGSAVVVGGFAVSTFTFNFDPDPPCVIVSVFKAMNSSATRIESKGYNTCDPTNPRRVERALRASY